ncbi:Diphosphoinositol polyphosphate phosphohydrolase 1 [Araneus ventricosus]|uniref:diphosphoinositol-polyphosphate diphosphatase n=1 Tax=Araneus ventricosus TaxID=182803 RepID=A0A4Y2S4J5_ARAVE|nr:Diphosphoinositol polyphosphate phosphohydrolase 1 [Araneus ventricosus]
MFYNIFDTVPERLVGNTDNLYFVLDGGSLIHHVVLLVTSSRAPERWIVPGGGLEPNEEPSVAAMREVVEEAGVRGHLGRCLGTFENPERKHRTSVFVLVVTEELDEWEDSKSIGSMCEF